MITIKHAHSWDLSPGEARGIQLKLKNYVVTEDLVNMPLHFVAGVDVGFEDKGATTRAAVAVLGLPELELVEYTIARRKTAFPYVPGLLSFRETPAVLDALNKIKQLPDILLCDGQGMAHPRRFGIACHIGVLTDIPSIGVAKKRLCGTHGELGNEKGSVTALTDNQEEIGVVLRTRNGVKPLYVSVGHKISLPTAVSIVMACVTKYRLPETTRWADRIASNKTGRY